MTKILISPPFGGGWSTWADSAIRKFVLTYQPFIDLLEADKPITEDDMSTFLDDLERAHPGSRDSFFTGGVRGLTVAEVDGPFIVEEYDGSESIMFRSQTDWMEL